MSPFEYEHPKLEANICGGGMIAEMRTTCRGRASILGLRQARAQASGFLALGRFPRCRPEGYVSRALETLSVGTSHSFREVHIYLPSSDGLY